MALTIEQANNQIQNLIDNNRVTESSLKNIINQLDTYAGDGKKTILYSGVGNLLDGMDSDPNVRILDNTQASKFLTQAKELNKDGKTNPFLDALEIIYDEPADLQSSGGKSGNKANIFVNGIDGNPRTKGAWDTISENFVKKAVGEIDVYTGTKASPKRVYFQTEWEAIQNNAKITKINGYNRFDFNDKLTANQQFIKFQMLTSNKQRTLEALNNNISDVNKKLKIEDITNSHIKEVLDNKGGKYSEAIGKMALDYQDIKTNISNFSTIDKINIPGILTSLNRLGAVGSAVSFIAVTWEVIDAYNSGNTEKAKELMANYVAEVVTGAAGAYAGASLATLGLGVLATAGLAIGTVPAAIVIAAVSIIGGFAGSELATNFYENTLKELLQDWDNLNVIDEIRDLMNQANETISPIILDLDGDGIVETSAKNNIYFDHNNNGFAEQTAWARTKDLNL